MFKNVVTIAFRNLWKNKFYKKVKATEPKRMRGCAHEFYRRSLRCCEARMLTNYMKTTLRHFQKHRLYSLINILGLSTGLACCLLISLWVFDEQRYDQFHEKKDRLFQVYSEGASGIFAGSFYPLAQAMKENIPEIEEVTRFSTRPALLRYEGKALVNNRVGYIDASFLNMFSFPLLSGSREGIVADKYAIALTEETARKIFGHENPLGKVVSLNDQVDLTVRGIIKNVPKHSSLTFDCLVPFALQFPPTYTDPTHWGGNPLTTFVLLTNTGGLPSVAQKVTTLVQKSIGAIGVSWTFHFHPLARLHLAPPGEDQLALVIRLLSIVALLVLVAACINYMNLSTARASERTKEVGLRKVIGASRMELMVQFFGEALVLTGMAFVVAMFLVALFLPVFNELAGKELTLEALFSGEALLAFALIALLTAMFAGSYPALSLSAMVPAAMLRQHPTSVKGSKLFRYLLVTIQFVLTTIVIISILTINRQTNYIQNKDYGFERENLAMVRMTPQMRRHAATIKSELRRSPQIVNVTSSFQNVIDIGSSVSAVEWDGKNPEQKVSFNWDIVSFDYCETMNMSIVAGRSFSREFSSDTVNGYIVNEEAAKVMNLGDPVGKRLSVFRNEGTIVGVVKNFHFQPFYRTIRPFVFWCDPARASWLLVRVHPEHREGSVEHIRSVCRTFEKDYPIDIVFFNDALTRHVYTTEAQITRISLVFTVLIILISSLGLMGLTLFICEQRRKEIAIRKVLGATSGRMLGLLTRDFLKWIALANLIAWPLAYFAMEQLMAIYAYRASTDFTLYLVAAGGTLLLAFSIICCQTMKTARVNPVESLKYE